MVDMTDWGTCFQQFALSFGDVKGAYVLLSGPRDNWLSILLKVWELHWRDWTGQDVFCCLMVQVSV